MSVSVSICLISSSEVVPARVLIGCYSLVGPLEDSSINESVSSVVFTEFAVGSVFQRLLG